MALIPLKQTVTIRKLIASDNDGWEVETWSDPITMKCRAEETIKTIDSSSVTDGLRKTVDEKVVATLLLTFDKLPDIDYNTEITYTNELGVTIKRKPVLISPIRMINGKVAMTEVHL